MFFDDFSQLVENLAATPDRFLITGDFNFHIGTTNNDAVQFLDLINSAGLNQHVTRPTHNRGHNLDLIITSSNNDLVSNLQVLPSMPSDHAAITFLVDFPRPVLSKVFSERRKLQNINLELFVEDMANTSLMCNRSSDVDVAVTQYLLDDLMASSDIDDCHRYDKQPTLSSYELSTLEPVTSENVKSVIMSSRTVLQLGPHTYSPCNEVH